MDGSLPGQRFYIENMVILGDATKSTIYLVCRKLSRDEFMQVAHRQEVSRVL